MKTEPRRRKGGKRVKMCSCGSLHVCLITKMPLSYKLWKLKTHLAKMCIRELSDENNKLETELWCSQMNFSLWVPSFLSYELWKQSYELWKLMIHTASY